MYKILSILIGTVAMVSVANAQSFTDMGQKWTCTTNATAATEEADKASDDAMAHASRAANVAFKYAMDHCRDCTKISCEAAQ